MTTKHTRISMPRLTAVAAIALACSTGSALGLEVLATLLPSDFPDGGLGFGLATAVRGDLVVVGAPHDSDVDYGAGAAYVYRNLGGNWIEEAKLTGSDSVLNDFFGWSVAVDGELIVVSAPEAWDIQTGDASFKIAVIDSGVRRFATESCSTFSISDTGRVI